MKPKFVVKRREELSQYLNKLELKYLQLPDVKHFLSTGCETMEGEMGEGGGFELDGTEAGESEAHLDIPTKGEDEDDDDEDDEEDREGEEDEEGEEPLGLFLVIHDFKPESEGELTVEKGDRVWAYPGDDKQWVYCQKEEQFGYVPRTHVTEVEEET